MATHGKLRLLFCAFFLFFFFFFFFNFYLVFQGSSLTGLGQTLKPGYNNSERIIRATVPPATTAFRYFPEIGVYTHASVPIDVCVCVAKQIFYSRRGSYFLFLKFVITVKVKRARRERLIDDESIKNTYIF